MCALIMITAVHVHVDVCTKYNYVHECNECVQCHMITLSAAWRSRG